MGYIKTKNKIHYYMKKEDIFLMDKMIIYLYNNKKRKPKLIESLDEMNIGKSTYEYIFNEIYKVGLELELFSTNPNTKQIKNFNRVLYERFIENGGFKKHFKKPFSWQVFWVFIGTIFKLFSPIVIFIKKVRGL